MCLVSMERLWYLMDIKELLETIDKEIETIQQETKK